MAVIGCSGMWRVYGEQEASRKDVGVRYSGVNEFIEDNRKHWDELVSIHEASAFYDVESFGGEGRNTLHALERGEVGDVSGKTLLHLQCHFGLDTLSWKGVSRRDGDRCRFLADSDRHSPAISR